MKEKGMAVLNTKTASRQAQSLNLGRAHKLNHIIFNEHLTKKTPRVRILLEKLIVA